MTCFTGVFLKKLTEYLYCTKSRGEMVSLSHFENVLLSLLEMTYLRPRNIQ